MISKELLEILCCPVGQAPLKQEDGTLVCTKCGAVYPIKDGIPILLADEAQLPEGVDDITQLKCFKKE
jgi:hypothetical protein